MSLTRKIFQNTFIQILSKAVVMAFGLLTVGIMTRYFGREGFGQYTTIIAFLQFFGIIVDFGLAVVIVQLISARPAETEKLTNNIFTFRFITALVFFAIAPLAVWFFPYSDTIKWGVAITSGAMFFTSLNQLIVGLFQRELKMGKVAIAEIAGRAVILLGVVLVTYAGWSLLPVMGAVTLGNLVSFILILIFSRSIVKIRPAFDWAVWREVFHKSWPIGLSIIFNLVYFKADTVILSLYRGQAEVGIYGATYKVLEILSTLPYLFMGLILPLFSAAWAVRDLPRFRDLLQRSWDFMAVVTLPVLFGGLILAESVMVFVAGPEFAGSGGVLRILLVATAAIYLSTIFNHAIVALEQQKKMLLGFAGVAVISVVGYLWLIPIYSYWAAAWVTVLAESLILIISAAVVYRAIKSSVSLKIFGLSFFSSLVMSAVLLPLLWWGVNLAILLILGAIVYFLVLFLIGGLERETIREVLGKDKL